MAPAQALAEQVLGTEPSRPVTPFFSGRTAADAIGRARFEQWARRRPGFRYLLTLTRDLYAARRGRVPVPLAYTFDDLRDSEVFVAGASGFVVAGATAARALGAGAVDVHTEEFFTEQQPWTAEPARPLTRSGGR